MTLWILVRAVQVLVIASPINVDINVSAYAELYTISLGSAAGVVKWSVSNRNGSIADVAAVVPGCIHTDLQTANVIGEPNFGRNSQLQRWIASDNFTYMTSMFDLPQSLLAKRNINLVLSGMDTAVTVSVNGKPVLTEANMHRTFVVDVAGLVRASGNHIVANFTGPVPASLAAEAVCASTFGKLCSDAACTCPNPWPGPAPDPLIMNAYIRKEQQSFSWDFAPPTGTSGITTAPLLVGYDSGLLRDVVVDTTPDSDGGWTVVIAVRMWSTHGTPPGSHPSTLTASFNDAIPNATHASSSVVLAVGETMSTLYMSIPSSCHVQPWWPNGYGKQSRYALNVSLTSAETNEHQVKTVLVGFRTITIEQPSVDGGGDSHLYRFMVNGKPIYARGSNWVPSQSLNTRVIHQHLVRHFDAYRAGHFTSLRVWGGGVYVSDDFLNLADEYGIIISHDFQFGDQFYPVNDEFLLDVAAEVRDQVWRMGSHPSLGVWCGNNEMASGYSEDHHLWTAQSFYSKLYFSTIKSNLSAVDPHRTWISSTPSQGNETSATPYNRNGSSVELRGDMHFYGDTGVAANCWNVSEYPRARFVTESGWESWPSFITMQPTLDPNDYGFNATVPVTRQQHPPGQQQITNNVVSNWLWPDKHAGTTALGYRNELWMTQVAASQCLTSAIEFWRSTTNEFVNTSYALSPRGWAMLGGNAGVLYWQADDTWPGPSWSTIEVGGRLKVGHYAVQRLFAPLLVCGRITDNDELHVYFSRASYAPLSSSPPSSSSSSSSSSPSASISSLSSPSSSSSSSSDAHRNSTTSNPEINTTSMTNLTTKLRFTSFRWAGGMSGPPVRHTVTLPEAHSSTQLFSASLASVLTATGCNKRRDCVLELDVVGVVSGSEVVLATNTVYLSPLHQVTTMVKNPGLAIRRVSLAREATSVKHNDDSSNNNNNNNTNNTNTNTNSSSSRNNNSNNNNNNSNNNTTTDNNNYTDNNNNNTTNNDSNNNKKVVNNVVNNNNNVVNDDDEHMLLTFTVTVTANQIPVALVWLESTLAGRWSDNGVLLTTPELQLQFFTDVPGVTTETLTSSLSVWSLVDVASGYTTNAPHTHI